MVLQILASSIKLINPEISDMSKSISILCKVLLLVIDTNIVDLLLRAKLILKSYTHEGISVTRDLW